MTVAVDTTTEHIRTATTTPQTFSHVGASSGIKGVLLILVNNGSSTDSVTAASYGTGGAAVALTRVHRAVDTAGESGSAQIWFRGSGIPQGTQNASYTPGSTGDDFQAVCITLTGAGDLMAIKSRGVNGDVANPSVVLQVGGHDSMAFLGYFSGLAAPSSITDGSGITRLQDHDFGQQASIVVRQTTASTSDFTFSFTASADDVAIAAVSITDAPVNQDTWRWRKDDANEASATWLEVAGADHEFYVGSNAKARIRFALSDAGACINFQPVLERAYSMTVGYDISTAAYASKSYDYSARGTNPAGFFIDAAGTHFYTFQYGSSVYEYSCSAWDISTGSYQSRTLTTTTQNTNMRQFCFSSTGSKLYQVASTNDIYEYGLTTAWDLSSGSYATTFNMDAFFDGSSYVVSVSADNKRFYVAGSSATIYQVDMSGGSLSTAVYNGESFVSAQYVSQWQSMAWRADGTSFYISDNTTIYQYDCSTAWDLTTAVYSSKSFTFTQGAGSLHRGIAAFKTDGGAFCCLNSAVGDYLIYQHSMTVDQTYWNYEPVTTTSTKVKATDSSYLTNANDTTQQITSGTFISPNSGVSETGTAGTDNDLDFTAGSKCEVEYAIEFIAADVVEDEVIRFRVKNVDSRSEV